MSHIEGSQRLETISALGRSDPWNFTALDRSGIAFIASNFWALDWPTLNSIPLSILIRILSHPSLQIQTENWSCYFIFTKLLSGREYFQLFEFVHFDQTCDCVRSHFLELASEYRADFEAIIRDASGRFPKQKPFRFRPEEAPGRYTMWDHRYHIFKRLGESWKGNLHDAGIVTVTAKSNCGADWSHPRNILDPDLNNRFESGDEPNQWICCDFHDRRVTLDYMEITSDGPLPRSMKAEASSDGEHWTRIDAFSPMGDGTRVFWRFVSVPQETYRFVRLTQTELNSRGDHRLNVQRLSLKGRIFGVPNQQPHAPDSLESAEV
jgi:hypothetical protein